MTRLWVAVAAALLTLAACESGPVPSSGTVTSQDHRSAYMTYIPGGKVYVPIFHPESWYLQVEDCDPPPCFRGWVEVSSEAYYSHPLGTQWP